MGRRAAAALLDVALRTLRRYLQRYRRGGPEGFLEAAIVEAKRARPHRSARKLRDLLRLPVSREAVRRVLVRHGLHRLGLPPVKPVQRFVAAAPNALWQIDILGTVRFPLLGDLYLILALDDPSRFILAGGFFPRKFRIHLFTVMHTAFTRWGLPQRLPSDRESQFKSTAPVGEADSQDSARRLRIELVDRPPGADPGENRAAIPVHPAGLRPGASGGRLGRSGQRRLRPGDRGLQPRAGEPGPRWGGSRRPLRPLHPDYEPRT